jgi:putative transcriptional regulator
MNKSNELKRREWLKELRKKQGYTVREFAPILNCSFSHYSDIENGRKNPSLPLAVKISKQLNFAVDKFISA